jgi:hypothetical protein
MTREQELWGIALWVKKKHGADAQRWIAEQIGRLAMQTTMRVWRCGGKSLSASKHSSTPVPAPDVGVNVGAIPLKRLFTPRGRMLAGHPLSDHRLFNRPATP